MGVVTNVAVLPYKIYTALLTQSGTNNPTVIVLENTLGGVPVWTRHAEGVFYGTLTGVFAEDKTAIFTGFNLSGNFGDAIGIISRRLSSDIIEVLTGVLGDVPYDGYLFKNMIEIRVYT